MKFSPLGKTRSQCRGVREVTDRPSMRLLLKRDARMTLGLEGSMACPYAGIKKKRTRQRLIRKEERRKYETFALTTFLRSVVKTNSFHSLVCHTGCFLFRQLFRFHSKCKNVFSSSKVRGYSFLTLARGIRTTTTLGISSSVTILDFPICWRVACFHFSVIRLVGSFWLPF